MNNKGKKIDWLIDLWDLEKIHGYGASKAIHRLKKRKLKKSRGQKKLENPNLLYLKLRQSMAVVISRTSRIDFSH